MDERMTPATRLDLDVQVERDGEWWGGILHHWRQRDGRWQGWVRYSVAVGEQYLEWVDQGRVRQTEAPGD